MNKFTRYLPITKVDQDQHMVYGWASTPDLDSDGEIIAVEAFEKALPDYMKFPTIREMHQPKAVGKTQSAELKKGKGLYIAAKIVAEDAWKLVKEGVYTAFSIGGHVIQKMDNVIKEIDLVEISLVDVPANKAAVLEVWKAEKFQKDASSVAMLSELMMHLQMCIDVYSMRGKKTRQLEKILEQVKGLISTEAQEKEPKEGESYMMMSDSPETIKQLIKSLEAWDIKDNPMAKAMCKGVILAMSKKAEELEKKDKVTQTEERSEVEADEVETKVENQEEVIEEGKSEEVETPEVKEEVKEENSESETQETEAEEEEIEESHNHEVSEEDSEAETEKEEKEVSDMPTLSKVEQINERLAKISPVAKKEVERLSLEKTVNALAGSLSKMVSVLEDLEKRVVNLEMTPAATKSKAAFVSKTMFDSGEESDKSTTPKNTKSERREEIVARLKELGDLRTKLGNSQFAHGGLSAEAMRLQSELETL